MDFRNLISQYDNLAQSKSLDNADLGLMRMCLGASNLASEYEGPKRLNVDFISPPQTTRGGLPEIKLCIDADGTLIELIQLHLDKMVSIRSYETKGFSCDTGVNSDTGQAERHPIKAASRMFIRSKWAAK